MDRRYRVRFVSENAPWILALVKENGCGERHTHAARGARGIADGAIAGGFDWQVPDTLADRLIQAEALAVACEGEREHTNPVLTGLVISLLALIGNAPDVLAEKGVEIITLTKGVLGGTLTSRRGDA